MGMNEDEFAAMILDDILDPPQREVSWSRPCERCGHTVCRYRGDGDVVCQADWKGENCGAVYNAGGQRLRDDAPTFGVGGVWGPEDDYDDYPDDY